MQYATYVTWEELVGSRSTIDELRQELRQIQKAHFIHACALVNTILRTWRGNIDIGQYEKLIDVIFAPQFGTPLKQLAHRDSTPRYVFHRQQLLFLIKEAAIYGAEIANYGEEDFNRRFAICCLRANDLLSHGLAGQPEIPRVERLLPELVTIGDYILTGSLVRKVARTRIMLEELAKGQEAESRPDFIDIQGEFERVSGITLRQFSNLLFAILSKYVNMSSDSYSSDRNVLVLSPSYFSNTAADPESIERFLADVSTSIETLGRACTKNAARNDFTALKDRPLVETAPKRYIPIDVGFLVDKFEMGVFWKVHFNALEGKQLREQLHAFWGFVFERYVTQLLNDVCLGSPNKLVSNPQFVQGGESCDGIIICGPNAVFMEYKGSMLRGEAKYSGSPDLLTEEIVLKFVGTNEKPKGARQLARSILKFGNKLNPSRIVDLDHAARIYPVLVARESCMGTPLVNYFLNRQFKALYNHKQIRPTVTPLFVMTVDELEEISPYLIDTRFDEILDTKHKADRTNALPFSALPMEQLLSKPSRVNYRMERRFEGVINELSTDLFGKTFEEVKAARERKPNEETAG